ncbi:MAG: hypothetical protein QOF51_815 [Chloroflexota bacterium]|jgi:hypothetical protein|nr:hypothetical protein [Chloroflexota bacterium]
MLLRGLKRFARLSGEDRLQFLEAYVALGTVDVALRLRGFQKVVGDQALSSPIASLASAQEIDHARRYAHWLEIASRHHIVRAQCLHCSLALWRRLRKAHMPGELRIGVRKTRGELKAHAWVEIDGQPVFDRPEAVAAFIPLRQADGNFPTWARDNGLATDRGTIRAGTQGLRWE